MLRRLIIVAKFCYVTYLKLGPKHQIVTMNEVLFRPTKTTIVHAGKNEEPQADTVNNFFFQFLLEMVNLNPLRLF